MIKIENTEVYGWKAAVRGMRNPMNSWSKSDSQYDVTGFWDEQMTLPAETTPFIAGDNDLKLMKTLVNAGSDHGKFMRMITVTCDITAPLYWVAEHDTYKVGTVRNSCSFMHKGVSKPFTINDFSIQDERVYYLLNDIEKQHYELVYPYQTDEYKIYETRNGRQYKVYKNGKIVACKFSYVDCYGTGRKRTFEERECKPSQTKGGYYEINIGGRGGEKWLVHRLVASVWIDNPDLFDTVNHINGNKGDNSVENLEWCSRQENIKKGFAAGLYDVNKLHLAYNSWKNGFTTIQPHVKAQLRREYERGIGRKELAEKYKISQKYVGNALFASSCKDEELFLYAYTWEKMIDTLNGLRELYLETKDDNIFKEIRQLLPQGYNVRYTWQANYEVLRNMYHARKNHKLDCWRDLCAWIETLPYAKELICNVG